MPTAFEDGLSNRLIESGQTDAILEEPFIHLRKRLRPVFLTIESRRSSVRGRLRKSTLWVRLNTIGEDLKPQGVVRQSIEFSAHLFRRSFLTQLSKAGSQYGLFSTIPGMRTSKRS